jgi:hypothetical protein
MRLPRNQAISFYLMANNLYNTTTAFTELKTEILQWRLRQCINSSLAYYALPEQVCYDNCSHSTAYTYGENTTYQFCAQCSVSCLTCAGDGVSCTSCNATNNRALNNATSTCDCTPGYFNLAGFKGCPACDYSCLTCTNSSTTCTSCAFTRALANHSCNCLQHFFDNQTSNFTCAPCDYKCLTCQLVSANCTSCNSTSNRIFDSQNLKCPCASQFE